MAAAMSALAETTMEFMRQEPRKARMFRSSGFALLWAGITRRRYVDKFL
jgi:hypothetical protein